MYLTISMKSGTSGHSDMDDCDFLILSIDDCKLDVPAKYDTLVYKHEHYLVTDVKRVWQQEEMDWKEYVSVYVIMK